MTTLHLTRGLPASGKTTFAREWVAESPASRARVNRDDMRVLLHRPHAGKFTEDATTTACHAAIRAFLRNNRDVVVDDTNLNAGNVKRLLKLAEQCGADVEYHDFPLTVAESMERDATREVGSVGADVIDRFSRYLGKGDALPPAPVLAASQAEGKPYAATPGTPKAVVVDIDGTLAHNYGHRSFYDYTRVADDAVHEPVLALLWQFITGGYTPVIMSGRDDSCLDATAGWLNDRCGLQPSEYVGPFMRATGDRRDDAIVKLELFDEHVRDHFDVRYVLDDRDRVVRAWRSIGLTVLQVADGDF